MRNMRVSHSARACLVWAVVFGVGVCTLPCARAQGQYYSGQNVAVAFEGWEINADGSFNMVFGYYNRNLDEKVDVPIGAENNIEPGGPDQGQPTHFLPQRNHYVFSVWVPKDFGAKELVWTLTSRGKTEKAYATLRPEYVLNDLIRIKDTGGGGNGGEDDANQRPTVTIEGAPSRSVHVGQDLTLSAIARDDGIPRPRPNTTRGLRVAWFVYRGDERPVHFEPEQFKVYPDKRRNSNSPWSPGWTPPPLPADGRFPVKVTFDSPGSYMLRVLAHDGGGLDGYADVTVTVTPR